MTLTKEQYMNLCDKLDALAKEIKLLAPEDAAKRVDTAKLGDLLSAFVVGEEKEHNPLAQEWFVAESTEYGTILNTGRSGPFTLETAIVTASDQRWHKIVVHKTHTGQQRWSGPKS